MLRVLLNLITSLCIACFLATLILWTLVLCGQAYAFGGTAGSEWGARAERIGFFVHWNASDPSPGKISWSQIENADLADFPGLHVSRMNLIAEPPIAPQRTIVRSITALHIQYWVLILVFGVLPAMRLAWLRGKIRRQLSAASALTGGRAVK